jgi:hypothetical protein
MIPFTAKAIKTYINPTMKNISALVSLAAKNNMVPITNDNLADVLAIDVTNIFIKCFEFQS